MLCDWRQQLEPRSERQWDRNGEGMSSSSLSRLKYRIARLLSSVLLPSLEHPIDFDDIESILIYGAMGIGNMIMFTPTLRAIRRRFPDAHITLLVAQSGCEEVVRGSSLVDEIIKANPERWENLRLAKQIRDRRFDLLISEFHGGAFSRVTLLSGIPYRVGHCTSPGWESRQDYLYNVKMQMGADEHEIDRDLRLAKALGIQVIDDSPLFYISDDDVVFANDFLQKHGVQDDQVVVGVQIGTWRVQSWKQWDLTRLARVCDRLMEDFDAKVIALGSPNHQEELDTFLSATEQQPIAALGKANVKQAAAIVERCDFTICNDSGLMHISAAMDTPVIATYGPTDYHRTSPRRYGDQHIVVRKDLVCSPCFRLKGDEKVLGCPNRCCIEMITVEDVLSAVEEMVGEVSEQADQ